MQLPVAAAALRVSSTKNGATAEVALVGSEGVVGVGAFPGGGQARSGAVVQCAGHGLRVSAQAIADPTTRSPTCAVCG